MKTLWTFIQILISAVMAAAIVFRGLEVFEISYDETIQQSDSGTESKQNETNQPMELDQSGSQQDGMLMLHWFEKDLVSIINQVSPSVVSVVANQDFEYRAWWLYGESRVWTRQLWWWSGFLVSRDGYIITNRHVVDDTRLRYSIVFEDGNAADVDTIWLDPSLDIAVIKISAWSIPESVTVVDVVSLDQKIQIWQFAFAVGNSLAEFQNSVSLGIISWRNRSIDIGLRNRYAGLYQTDASISQWNSGGPLFDTQGRVIGVNTAVSSIGENIWFSIPITQEFIQATLLSIQEFDAIRRPFIGISYVDLDPASAVAYEVEQTQGVLVQEVVQWSAAAMWGIQAWDIITRVDGKSIDDESPLQYLLFTKLPNDTITLGLVRDMQELEVVLKLGEQ